MEEQDPKRSNPEADQANELADESGTHLPAVASSTAADWKREVVDWVKALAVAAVLVIVIRWFLFSPYIVDGPSMKPNFHTGERVIVNKIIYDLRPPGRGEVVVFHSPYQADYIKRVVGLPGETVEVREDAVLVNGEALTESYIKEEVERAQASGVSYNSKNFVATVVPEGHVFVMGDNRPNSHDSRDIGFIAYEEIVGRADVIIWPIGDIRIISHP